MYDLFILACSFAGTGDTRLIIQCLKKLQNIGFNFTEKNERKKVGHRVGYIFQMKIVLKLSVKSAINTYLLGIRINKTCKDWTAHEKGKRNTNQLQSIRILF